MTRFIHITDLHISDPQAGDPLYREAPLSTLKRVVETINAMDPQPEFVIASGDLTNTGHPLSYKLLHEYLAPLQAPLILTLGNHDVRGAFYESLGEPATEQPFCHDHVIGGLHVIALDTSIAGRTAGTICDTQFSFLETALTQHVDLPKLIVMHHPPCVDPESLPWGRIDIAATSRLAETVKNHNVAGILSGHIHINRVSHWHGIPIIVSNGQDSAIDQLETNDLRIVEGTGFGICDWRPSGLSVSFVPLSPSIVELAVVDREQLLAFT